MLCSIHILTSLLAIRAVEGSVLAERHTAVPINLQFSVPGSVFSALSNGNFLSNYLRKETQSGSNRGQSYNNLDIKQLAQGLFVIDRFLSEGPDAAARLGATFSGGPGEGKVPSTSPVNNNPDDESIYSEHTAAGAAGPNGADDSSLSAGGFANGLAAL
ncbi:unnamed protein product [Cercospora beticola]|nr:unnamed protein product [Cercospora beticola]